jgi:hypothetical protein
MATMWAEKAGGVGTGALLFACVAEHGSAAHPYFASESLVSGPDCARNLADMAHFLSGLHGRHPGVVDLAVGHTSQDDSRAWLVAASEAMVGERALLTRLVVAAGSAPSTPGSTAAEAAVIAQRNAIHTLAQSDRRGCALGAALAFAADWVMIRDRIDAAARRFGFDPPPRRLGNAQEIALVASRAGDSATIERAILFGAQQLALQHRGLWDLLEARQHARRDR